MERSYPRQSLGWAFQRVMGAWGIPEARLARHLAVSPSDLVQLAVCLVPPAGSPGFDDQVDDIAQRFGISRWHLAFVCRAALVDPPRLRPTPQSSSA
jgi:hypothetical protein